MSRVHGKENVMDDRVELTPDQEALEAAWGIIANAGGGDWTKESPEWQEAAARWRDRVLPDLSKRMAEAAG